MIQKNILKLFQDTTHGVTGTRMKKENYMDLKGDDMKKVKKNKKKKDKK